MSPPVAGRDGRQRLTRGLVLTDKAYAALRVSRTVPVPIVRLPWRPDSKDKR